MDGSCGTCGRVSDRCRHSGTNGSRVFGTAGHWIVGFGTRSGRRGWIGPRYWSWPVGKGGGGTGRYSAEAGIGHGWRSSNASENQGCCCGEDGRTSAISRGVLGAILHGLLTVFQLLRQRGEMLLAHGGDLTRVGTDGNASATAVVADAVVVVGDVVVHHGARVGIADVEDTDVGDGTVVHEPVMVPVAALVAFTVVAVAIGNPAVVADVWSPVALVEAEDGADEAPPAGRPEGAGIGRRNPDAGHPVVALLGVAPVAGGPEIAGLGAFGLIVLR